MSFLYKYARIRKTRDEEESVNSTNPKVSVVIPVYNVEKYLRKCVKSVCAQTEKDIEIICVNDGSTDKSRDIIERIMRKDKRVICIDKKNSGYGHSMNVGFDAAKGEYICIVESDDYIEKDTIEILYSTAKEKNLDVIKSDYYVFTSKSPVHEYINTCEDNSYYNKVIGYKKEDIVFDFRMNTWTGLYRKDFLRKNNIKHNITPGASYQDNGFWFQTIALAERLMFINKAFYHYRQDNPNSSINSKSKIYCMSEEYDYIYDFLNENKELKDNYFIPYFKKRFFNSMTTYERVANENKLLFLERFAQDLKRMIEENQFNLIELKDEWLGNMVQRIVDDYELFFYEDMKYKYESEYKMYSNYLSALQGSEEIKNGAKIKNIYDAIRGKCYGSR